MPVSMMWRMWIAQDDNNPTRRLTFGDNRERAEHFAGSLDGWSVRSDAKPGWVPFTGLPPRPDMPMAHRN